MIQAITLTMNPAIDRTVSVDRLIVGGLNRLKDIREDPSGKGINVSIALKKLGVESLAMGAIGGETGRRIEEYLDELSIAHRFTRLTGSTRVNTKVREIESGRITELNERGPALSENELAALRNDFLSALSELGPKYVIMSGSLPPGAGESFYAELASSLERLGLSGLRVVIDASGKALEHAIRVKPFLVKPNKVEIQELFGVQADDHKQVAALGRKILQAGVSRAIVSLGADGAVFVSSEGCFHAKSSPVQVRSTTGCGDTIVAAAVTCDLRGVSWKDTAAYAVAAATAAAVKEGTTFPDEAEVESFLGRIRITEISD